MTLRKGGLGRRPGKKKICCQKRKSKTSLTKGMIEDSKNKKYLENKLKERCERRIAKDSSSIDEKATIDSSKEELLSKEVVIQRKRLQSLTHSLNLSQKKVKRVTTKLVATQEECRLANKELKSALINMKNSDIAHKKDVKKLEEQSHINIISKQNNIQLQRVNQQSKKEIENVSINLNKKDEELKKCKKKAAADLKAHQIDAMLVKKGLSIKMKASVEKYKTFKAAAREDIKKMRDMYSDSRGIRLEASNIKINTEKILKSKNKQLSSTEKKLQEESHRKSLANKRYRKAIKVAINLEKRG